MAFSFSAGKTPRWSQSEVFQQDQSLPSRATKRPRHQDTQDAGLQHKGPDLKLSLPEEAGVTPADAKLK